MRPCHTLMSGDNCLAQSDICEKKAAQILREISELIALMCG